MMSIERRRTSTGAARYSVRIKHHGRLIASRTFHHKADAESWEREQYRALRLGQFISPQRSSTHITDVIDQFLESRRGQVAPHTWRTDKDNLAAIRREWGNWPISSIGESEVLKFLTGELRHKAPSTVARSRTTISALFTFAIRERLVAKNPVRGVRLPRGEGNHTAPLPTFTEAEFARTLALQRELNPAMAEVTEFLSLTGVRWSELRALRVADVQLTPFPHLRVTRAQSDGYEETGTKTGKSRTVPLSARAAELAAGRVVDRAGDAYLFTGVSGAQLRGSLFARLLNFPRTAPGRTIHDLRHLAASRWLRSGLPVHQVAQWLGHANPNTTLKVYAHVLGEEQDQAAVALLDAIALGLDRSEG